MSQDDTIVGIHLLPAGTENIPLGAPLSLLADDDAALQALRAAGKSKEEWLKVLGSGTKTAAAPASAAPAASAPAQAPAPQHGSATSSVASAIAALPANTVMPSARILLAENNIDPSRIAGSGKGGRITKGDVLSVLSGASHAQPTASASASSTQSVKAAAPTAPSTTPSAPVAPTTSAADVAKTFAPVERKGGSFTEKVPSQVRRIIAQRLAESKAGIPHQYTVQDCYLDAALKLRAVLKENGIAVSVNDIIIKAAAKALKDVPEANCYYDPKTDTVKPNKTVDVSVAVATDGGLITPIIKGADALGLSGISGSIKDLAARARANRLKPEEFQGGSFTISNLGMFGIDEFTAVINPPQACIVAVGRGEAKVIGAPITSIDDLDTSKPVPEPTVATVMSVTMSSDARVVDAAVAAQFLQVFRHYIQNPTLLVA